MTASMVITVDESSKDDRTIFRRYGRAPSGYRAQINADFVRGERYSLIGAMSGCGFVGTRVVHGSVDSEEFFNLIAEDIVSCIIMNQIWILMRIVGSPNARISQ